MIWFECYNKLPVKDINIGLDGHTLEVVKSEKNRVIIDQNLNWKDHVDKVHTTVSILLAQFRQMTPFLQMPELNTLNHSNFPTLTIVAVSGAMPNLTDYLNYKSAPHITYNLPTGTPTKPRLDRLKWVTIMDMVHYRKKYHGIQISTCHETHIYERHIHIHF